LRSRGRDHAQSVFPTFAVGESTSSPGEVCLGNAVFAVASSRIARDQARQ
jgi:hypothetical protein